MKDSMHLLSHLLDTMFVTDLFIWNSTQKQVLIFINLQLNCQVQLIKFQVGDMFFLVWYFFLHCKDCVEEFMDGKTVLK